MAPRLHTLTLIVVMADKALRSPCHRSSKLRPDKAEVENSSDARTDPTGANDVYCGKAASWRFAGVAAEARAGIHRSASRGGDFAGRARGTRRSKPVSFCARLHAILRR